MIKQKNSQKVTALNKKRINLFKLEQRVTVLENQMRIQGRINRYQSEHNKLDEITKEEIFERLNELERIALPQQKQGCVRRLLAKFWDMLGR
ncbi:hypothetical protein B0186_04850 [Canicola haemoglobinophilus]|uniref:Uncharacterized protein n=1 Tax=Canicola haemoglobinophilus TaxID=733 RepID=A0A1V4B1N6_9PAST|nr:hypothetical protein [Canicola haemoglobinophilus]OOS01069.1 hypothetical protein B0186_04850 [Canicola haemoglobinophilus]STO58843.1 Uncharacterised protein [Canicola haemoglobinophilus]STO60307.1 Uncharacterised protein [Canicola haemoglobinophilus]